MGCCCPPLKIVLPAGLIVLHGSRTGLRVPGEANRVLYPDGPAWFTYHYSIAKEYGNEMDERVFKYVLQKELTLPYFRLEEVAEEFQAIQKWHMPPPKEKSAKLKSKGSGVSKSK